MLDALAANKSVWSKTVFILTYDENDGLFDHVPPAIAPLKKKMGASTVKLTGEDYHGEPFGLGPRVPMIVVSPWTAGGFVNSEAFDHTSVLRFLEMRFGVPAPNISPWRRTVTGDLTSVFDFSGTGHLPGFRDGQQEMKRADKECRLPQPHWHKEDLPNQERGRRPARALPYDLHVAGDLEDEGFVLEFRNHGRAGAAFRVASGAHTTGPWFFTVEPGKSLSYTLEAQGRYDFSVLGPNGFFRRFAGSSLDRISAEFHPPILFVRNEGPEPGVLRSAYDNSWSPTIAPASELTLSLDLASTSNWYDVLLQTAGGFVRQFAGHLEDGNPSFSDPLIG